MTMTPEDIERATENGYWGDALREHIATQDATIKALADALQRINDLADDIEDGPIGTIQAECDAAIRLAEALP